MMRCHRVSASFGVSGHIWLLTIWFTGWLWLGSQVALVRGAELATRAEPPFPQLTGWNRKLIKIVSEAVDEQMGTQTSEEYHDLNQYKSAFLSSAASQASGSSVSADNYRVVYANHEENLSYSYKPYVCKVTKISDLSDSLYDDEKNWNYNYKTMLQSRQFRFFGVYGLWKFANSEPRTFTRAQIVYSASKDIYRESLLWIVRDHEKKLDIKLFFIEHSSPSKLRSTNGTRPVAAELGHAGEEEPTLEMIQIEVDDEESRNKKRLIRTINILSIEFTLDEQVYANLFEPPLGFGCFSSLVGGEEEAAAAAKLVESRRRTGNSLLDGSQHSVHVELEVTATKYELLEGNTKEERRTDTYSVELAQAQIQGWLDREFIELIRVRNSRDDRKTVINHMLNVLYSIDMRQGTCEMRHISSPTSGASPANKTGPARSDELFERVSLEFDNSALRLDVSARLFQDPPDLHFVKRTEAATRQSELHFFEGGPNEALKRLERPKQDGEPRRVRMISTYVRNKSSLDLRTLTIWVLNEQQERIIETYQLTVIGARLLEPGWPDEAKLFDTSDECYLENDQMVQNRDYAWVQLTYPAPSRVLEEFSVNVLELEQTFYERAVMDFSRVPRIEVVFEEDSFIVRMLILEVPPTELVYEQQVCQLLMPAMALGDLSYLAPDLQHCGHFCRMNQCTVMSYCPLTSSCVLSSRRLMQGGSSQNKNKNKTNATSTSNEPQSDNQLESTFTYSTSQACDTYTMPASIERNQILKRNRLHAIIAQWQQRNYGIASLPELPDELALPLRETGLSERDFMQAAFEYQTSLNKYLDCDNRPRELVIAALIGGRFSVLVPSKFELESDPLREFNLYDATLDDANEIDGQPEARVPRFHQGLPGWRYNIGAQKTSRTSNGDESHQVEPISYRAFTGLTYDQCALACADTRCGSFSYCNNQGGDCILSNINSTGRARSLGAIQPDTDCFLMQRDFLANFVKFEAVYRPQTYTKTSEAGDASECALNCVAETGFKCLSFEFCDRSLDPKAPQTVGQCYYQTERHLPGNERLPDKSRKQSSMRPRDTSNANCDHYSRSYLADFVRLEFRRLKGAVIDQLKTSSFDGLSVFSCAEKCANELVDCTSFQFCHLDGTKTSREARQCTTIEGKITPQMLQANGSAPKPVDELETVVDEQAGGQVLHAGSYLEFDQQCQLFTLAKDTSESHLRELAFDGLVKTKREKAAEEEEAARLRGLSGGGLSFMGGLFLYLVVGLVSAALACGIIIWKERDPRVQQRIDRVRFLLRI